MEKIIKTDELTINDLPDDDADWPDILDFALTFDPMLELGSVDIYKIQFIEFDDESTLKELRRSLFLWQRGWNHISKDVDENGLQTLRDLLVLIRRKLTDQTYHD